MGRTSEPMADRTLDWTYEMPAAGDGASGLEDYVVEDARGGHAGRVGTVLRHEEELFLAVEHGTLPLSNELVVVPWKAIREVDHDSLRVRLGLEADDLDRAPRLDRSRKAENAEEVEADAIRVTDPPGLPGASAPTTARGPVDRPSYAVALWLGLLGVFGALVLAIFATGTDFSWQYALFLIPAGLIVFAAVVAYRIFRNPYARR
jgi:hypothetical protein